MTPKEKAEDLFNQYANIIYDRALTVMQYEICKQCALIAVDEILNSYPHTFGINKEYTKDGELVTSMVNIRPNISYWQEVKKEIELL
jgi:hypothetical protein